MKDTTCRRQFRIAFLTVCTVGVLVMVGYWFYKFKFEDRDIGVVDYVSLGKTVVDLPIASICFTNPFLEGKIKSKFPKFEEVEYLKHLKGDIWDSRYDDIEYENSTLDLNDYLLFASIEFRNGSWIEIPSPSERHKKIFNGVYRNNKSFVKCFSHQFPQHIGGYAETVQYFYNKTMIFEDLGNMVSSRPRISVGLYYPGQFLLARGQYYAINTTKFTVVSLDDIEFLKARRTRNRDCIEGWKSYDDLVLRKHIEKNGCIAPYHRPHGSVSRCKNKSEVKAYTYNINMARTNYFSPACHRISKIGFILQGQKYREQEKKGYQDIWRIAISYPDDLRIIQQSKEVDAHSLVGNIGGYVGLFLGNRHNSYDIC